MKKGKLKYVIFTGRGQSGGTIVLHALCKYLNDLGENAKVMYTDNTPYYENKKLSYWFRWFAYSIRVSMKILVENIFGPKKIKGYYDTTLRNVKRKITPFIDDNTVVVYSEFQFGNPLHAKNVVRWLLYYNRLYKKDGEKTVGYDPTDVFFAYREIYNDLALNPENRKLRTPFFDLDLYKRSNFGKRQGKCYVLKKGAWRVNPDDVADGIVIDTLPEEEKVKIFNQCEYCISYDTQTTYSTIAAMCGCISIVVPEEGKKRNDYRNDEDCTYGEAFGFSEEEIEHSKKTANLLKGFFENKNKESLISAQKFVNECESLFLQL